MGILIAQRMRWLRMRAITFKITGLALARTTNKRRGPLRKVRVDRRVRAQERRHEGNPRTRVPRDSLLGKER